MSNSINGRPEPKYVVRRFECWDSLYQFYRTTFFRTAPIPGEASPLWVFRGQADSSWKLKTKLEREFESAGVSLEKYGFFEEGLVREFQRRLQAAEEMATIPESDNVFAWLSLMQHHGAPTRLLDWSYSFFVALFFAVETGSEDAAVYAINARWCNDQSRQRLPDPEKAKEAIARDPFITTSSTFRNLFAREPELPFVYRVNTFALNTRLAIQQGLFLCPGALGLTFEQNLNSLDPNGNTQQDPVLHKLVIDKTLRAHILTELSYMNIGRHSLFPGLDGFAQSIGQFLKHSDRLYPDWRKKQKQRPFLNWKEWRAWEE